MYEYQATLLANFFGLPHFNSNTIAKSVWVFCIVVVSWQTLNMSRNFLVQQSGSTSFYLSARMFWRPISFKQYACGIFSFALCQRAEQARSNSKIKQASEKCKTQRNPVCCNNRVIYLIIPGNMLKAYVHIFSTSNLSAQVLSVGSPIVVSLFI